MKNSLTYINNTCLPVHSWSIPGIKPENNCYGMGLNFSSDFIYIYLFIYYGPVQFSPSKGGSKFVVNV